MARETPTRPPTIRWWSIYHGAPLPVPADPHTVPHPSAVPLCTPILDATGLGFLLPSPCDWAMRRTEHGIRIGWPTEHGIDWQKPDELGNTYRPQGRAALDGLPRARLGHPGKNIIPGRGVHLANVKPHLPAFVEVLSGWIFTSEPGWGLMVGAPTNRLLPPGVRVLRGYLRPWFRSLVPTIYELPDVDTTVTFRRGEPMAALVPLPDEVRHANAIDGRKTSGGVGEWPAEVLEQFVASSRDLYDTTFPGRYAAAAHRSDRRGGACPFDEPEAGRELPPPLAAATRLSRMRHEAGLDLPQPIGQPR
jgi:hypothetical protein